jgi:hypothetical protein
LATTPTVEPLRRMKPTEDVLGVVGLDLEEIALVADLGMTSRMS